jgi:hypothetical protein
MQRRTDLRGAVVFGLHTIHLQPPASVETVQPANFADSSRTRFWTVRAALHRLHAASEAAPARGRTAVQSLHKVIRAAPAVQFRQDWQDGAGDEVQQHGALAAGQMKVRSYPAIGWLQGLSGISHCHTQQCCITLAKGHLRTLIFCGRKLYSGWRRCSWGLTGGARCMTASRGP